jgi:hypothetical protein
MDLEMVLNELSMYPPATDARAARERMNGLILVVAAAVRLGVRPVLRTNEEFLSAPLASAYTLAQWLNDVDHDTRVFFLRIQTKAPFLLDLTDPAVKEKIGRSEFKVQNVEAIGLGVAYLTEGLAVSFNSSQRWNVSTIAIDITTINDEGSLLSETVAIVHALNAEHVREHEEWIQNRLKTKVRGGIDVWHRREELFPALSFCDSVRTQLQSIQPNDPILRQILKRLFELNNYAARWYEGPFDSNALPSKASTESIPTLREYGNERSFLCPDGIMRLFSWHVRVTPGAWRLHFFPETETRTLIIGYVGPKLPTVTDPT